MTKALETKINQISDLAAQLDQYSVVFDFRETKILNNTTGYNTATYNIIKDLFKDHTTKKSLLITSLVTFKQAAMFQEKLAAFTESLTSINPYQTWYECNFTYKFTGYTLISSFLTTTQMPQVISLGNGLIDRIKGIIHDLAIIEIAKPDLTALQQLIYVWQPVEPVTYWQEQITALADKQNNKLTDYLAQFCQHEIANAQNVLTTEYVRGNIIPINLRMSLTQTETSKYHQLTPEMNTILTYLAQQIKK